TKSGTNQLHGSLFEFFRNTKLDAANRFVNAGVAKDKFNLNQFGGSLGGALQKDNTFFFGDYQGTRKRTDIVESGLIPTPAMIGLINGYGAFTWAVAFVPGGSPGFAEVSAFASSQNITNHARNAVVSETHIFNDRNINQFTFGFNRIFNHIQSFGDKTCQAFKLGLLGANINPVCG